MRSAQQLLSIKTGSLEPSDTAKADISIFSRPSTLTLKLPKFHGDLLKWKDFWALFSSRLEKEPGLTDADKLCLLVEAMADSKAQQRAEAAIAHNTCFESAVSESSQSPL